MCFNALILKETCGGKFMPKTDNKKKLPVIHLKFLL